MRNELLAEVTGTATICTTLRDTCRNHVATSKHLQILELGIFSLHSQQELEAVKHNVMIETRVAVLERVLGVETRVGVQRTVSQQDGLTVCHTVCKVHIVSARHVNHSVVLNKVRHLRTPQLGEVPVRTIDIGHRTTHDSLYATRHLPTLTGCTENISVVVGRTLLRNVIIDTTIGAGILQILGIILIFIQGKRIRCGTTLNLGNSLTECISSTLGQSLVVDIGLTILQGTHLSATVSFCIQRRSCPQQNLT